MDWEVIHSGDDHVSRMEVPGGWLYKTCNYIQQTMCVTFVPFPPDRYIRDPDSPHSPDASSAVKLEAALS